MVNYNLLDLACTMREAQRLVPIDYIYTLVSQGCDYSSLEEEELEHDRY
jgi:hypothetical protein